MIPDLRHIVTQCKNENPEAWKNAHTGNEHTEDFIRLCAPMLKAEDSRFGLNGKRGNPNDLSDDAVNCLCDAEESDGRTPDNEPCVVIDVIGGAGGPNPTVGWLVYNTRIEGSGANVDPSGTPVPPTPIPPPVQSQPYPDEGSWWTWVFDVEVGKRYAQAGILYPDNASAFRWASRTAYDIAAGMTKEESLAKHLKELEQTLGLTP